MEHCVIFETFFSSPRSIGRAVPAAEGAAEPTVAAAAEAGLLTLDSKNSTF